MISNRKTSSSDIVVKPLNTVKNKKILLENKNKITVGMYTGTEFLLLTLCTETEYLIVNRRLNIVGSG